jgi:glycogen phosphorylase
MTRLAPDLARSPEHVIAVTRDALQRLARDLRWTWHREASALFSDLDPEGWEASGHNPEWLLQQLSTSSLRTALDRTDYELRLHEVVGEFDAFRGATNGWFQDAYPDAAVRVGLFAAEFAVADCLPIAAGGLGAVAGETLKTASGLGVPTVGIGLRYSETSHQWLDAVGRQHETWEPVAPSALPITLARDRLGFPVEVTAPLPSGPVRVRVWQVMIGRSRLLLLDTDVPGNTSADRDIARRLYPSDPDTRLRQYVVLGFAGYRALVALGLEPSVVHLNEGHTALAGVARIAALVQRHRLTFGEARIGAAPGIVFTTHTPVPAGHDYFAPASARPFLAPIASELGIEPEALHALGCHDPDDPGASFCPTVLGLRLAGHRNGVSQLHAVVARSMWSGLWPRVPVDEIPIGHVTNGVHLRSWVSPEMRRILGTALGADWEISDPGPAAWGAVRSIADEDLWAARNVQRGRLVDNSRRWLALQAIRRATADAWAAALGRLDPDALTIGFVGRFVAYKRPTLFLADRERLARILADADRPVQIVFAGRSHPADYDGKELLREVVAFARDAGLSHRIVFLEDFDIAMDRWLSQGVDVWLNTPRRPDEACGIAGMKAGINGALNFSTVDGWWDEAWHDADRDQPPIGWAIGGRGVYPDVETQDRADAESLYDELEHSIIPAFYDRDRDGVPRRWLASVRESITVLGPIWASSRMVREYTSGFYVPGSSRASQLTGRRASRARDADAFLRRARAAWSGIAVGPIAVHEEGAGVRVRAGVVLGELSTRDVVVQLWLDRGGAGAGFAPRPMQVHSRTNGERCYEVVVDRALAPPGTKFAVRVLPHHPSVDDPLSTGLVTWAG